MSQQQENIRIRKLTDGDLAKVIGIESLIHGKENKHPWPFSFESYWEIFHPNVNFVAEVDNNVIGFIVGKIIKNKNRDLLIKRIHSGELDFKNEWIGWIDMVGVHPDYHHRGLGQRLMETFFEECKNHNAIVRTALYSSDERYKRLLMNAGFKESNPVIYEKN